MKIFKGRMVWGDKKCDKAIILAVKKDEKAGLSSDYEIVLKHTRSIEYYDIMKLPIQ